MPVALAALIGLTMLGAAETPTEHKAPRMTKEQLKPLLGRSDLVIIDIRLVEQWKFSNRKIPGAVHENPTIPDTWMEKYPKDKTIVLYCA
jgi:rhodanese-related sulfurtransferase